MEKRDDVQCNDERDIGRRVSGRFFGDCDAFFDSEL